MRWTLKPKPDQSIIDHLVEVLQVPPAIAQLLAQRGIQTYEAARAFFRPKLTDLHDPFLMKDMDLAVNRIALAISQNENILVYGDYDVDGTTAVSLMSSYLRTLHDKIDTYIPDRYNEGYGISFQGIDYASDNDVTLIIALDCGIKSVDKVAYAKSKGIDFIICDHHRPGDELPAAIAVLDPKRSDCSYPYDELCGCGIGFKVIQALAQKQNQTLDDLVPYLDLVATAIGADIVPITGENRILAKFGLEVINTHPRPGIKALIYSVKKQILTINDVVFIIAPRINAAGRIKHGNYAVSLLTEFDFEEALQFAASIEQFNADRKELDKKITKEALLQIQQNKEENNFTTVVFHPEWHKGVIGIVASRLIETYYRPTLVFTKSGDKLAASARSVKGFDVYEALQNCTSLMEQFGGHKYAAGLTLQPHRFEDFKTHFEETVKNTIAPELLVPEVTIDIPLEFCEITPKFFRLLHQFEPFGPENMTPVFISQNLRDTGYAKTLGEDEHLKMFVKQGHSEGFGAIGFGLAHKLHLITNQQIFKAAYSLDENHWNGTSSIQLRIRDIAKDT